ncbi:MULTISPECIES: DMT family transporter [Bradyrhizobium]|jgi:drug/metabolite transporter (DMT)-like permease|uniref:DMT family transporter n=2 Tax=Nitrobacteraceae TaxID=41294 RepID=UPI0003A0B0CE|nr:DMT family transporter [Bradyrhizobium denitrificans]MCL8483811.1 DMT family transporter [Bradyrhizobium denitrificans]
MPDQGSHSRSDPGLPQLAATSRGQVSGAVTAPPLEGAGNDRAGALIVAISAVAFSTAGLFTRLVEADVWTMLFWRGLFGGIMIGAYVIWTERTAHRKAFTAIGWAGVLTATCSTAGTICFVAALRMTTVADVTIVYATAPFIAAGIAWVWTRERPRCVTLVASGLALLGVVILSAAPLPAARMLGNLLALTMTILLALMMVINRRFRHVSMVPAACLSAFACAVLVAPLADPMSVTGADLVLLMLFGTTQFGMGLLLLTIGSRRIPAARASLLGNLELPLAPLWIWIAFGELPSRSTLVGGAVVCAALLLDLAADQAPGRWLGRPPLHQKAPDMGRG